MDDIGSIDTISKTSQSSDLDDGMIDDISGELETIDLPEWLKEIKTGDSAQTDELMDAEAAKKLDDIPKGELPEWIQEMQPVESMLSQEDTIDEKLNEFVESSGPLAGLSGVLPPADGIKSQHQTTSHPETPILSGEQDQQVELFKQILNSESEPISTHKQVRKSSSHVLRWLVTILLISAVILPVIIGFPISIPATNYPPELIQTRQVLFGLPADSPVLMIFDYGPAYSTELEASSSSIVGELINSNVPLVFISTSPTGIALADHFMEIVKSQRTLLIEPRIIKLGYLPGDIQGIASFASNPSHTLPFTTSGTQAWETQELMNVSDLSGFSAVFLLTENPDTARVWVEQAGRYLGDTPILVAASAQAEPMIRPYYESKQIDGLVTGLAGGKAYEQMLETSGLSGSYWNSFRSGLFMIEVIIIIGGIWSFLGSLRVRKLERKEEV